MNMSYDQQQMHLMLQQQQQAQQAQQQVNNHIGTIFAAAHAASFFTF